MEAREVYQVKQKINQLIIGQTETGEPFQVPLSAGTQKLAILGKSGSGKTYAATGLAELLYEAGIQIVALDPVGVWYGLRLTADGKGDGLPIPVFGGEYGDIPLEPGAGALVAETIVSRNISVILDVSNFRKNQRREFVTSFAEELFHLKKTAKSPIMLFLEEAQFFIPQKVFKGEERLLGAFEDIGKVGRNYGIGLTMISQRPQAVNKDVLNQAEMVCAMQMSGSQERKAIRDWIDAQGIDAGAAVDQIPNLGIGEAYIWSPQWLKYFGRIKFRQKKTYNASETPTFNTKTAAPRLLDSEALARLQEAMQEVVKSAQAKDPAILRRRIQELERELKAQPQAARPEKIIERVEVPIIPDYQLEEMRRMLSGLTDTANGLAQLGQALVGAAQGLQSSLDNFRIRNLSEENRQKPEVKRLDLPAPKPANGSIQLRAGEVRMLQTLAPHPDGLTRIQLATLAGYAVRGGTFNTYLSVLRTNNLIEEITSRVRITAAGLNFLGPDIPVEPQTTQEILAIWQAALRSGERRMLDILIEMYPDTLNRQELAEKAGYEVSGGTFNTYLSVLRRNGLIEDQGREIRASGTLFLN